MPRFRVFAAWLVALLWLPASLHCGLDAADLLNTADACCQHEPAPANEANPCSLGVCGVVESGNYQPAQNSLKVSAPSAVLLVFAAFGLAPILAPEPEQDVFPMIESPPEMRRTWHLVARAALSPRAPSPRLC
jgi:hypothetical protein